MDGKHCSLEKKKDTEWAALGAIDGKECTFQKLRLEKKTDTAWPALGWFVAKHCSIQKQPFYRSLYRNYKGTIVVTAIVRDNYRLIWTQVSVWREIPQEGGDHCHPQTAFLKAKKTIKIKKNKKRRKIPKKTVLLRATHILQESSKYLMQIHNTHPQERWNFLSSKVPCSIVPCSLLVIYIYIYRPLFLWRETFWFSWRRYFFPGFPCE